MNRTTTASSHSIGQFTLSTFVVESKETSAFNRKAVRLFRSVLAAASAASLLTVPPVAAAATYDWNTTNGTWDTLTANWSGAGSTWVDGSDAVFNNTATASTVALSGTINATSVLLGNATAANNNGNYSLIGGTLNDSGTLVVQGNATNGATYTSNPTASINSTVTVSGSTLIGRANLNITGGSYTTSRFTANPASVDWANLTISGGNVTATNGIDGTYGGNGTNGSTATFQLNLNGGTLNTPLIKVAARESSGTARLTFNGTMVKATASTAAFITLYGGTQNAYISNGGALFDTNGNDITVGVILKSTSGQTGTLTKSGTGTLTLSGANTYNGSTTVSGGNLTLSATGAIAGSTLTVNSAAKFNNNGGSAAFSGAMSLGVGSSMTFSQTAGTTSAASLTVGSSGDFGLISLTGGNFTVAGNATTGRNNAYTTAPTLAAPIAAVTTSGIYVNGGAASFGSLTIGTSNSSASVRLDSGSITVGGTLAIGKSTSNRWNILQINGGTFTALDTLNGVVIAQNNGTSVNNAEFYLSGGTATAGRVGFGSATDTVGGSGFLILGNSTLAGTLYVGSGGIVKASPMGNYTYTVGLTNGTLGASANWTSSLNMTLGTNPTIKSADAGNAAQNISLGGVLSGGGFTKSGGGTLTLTGNNTYNGTTTVSAGTLLISGGGAINSSSGISVATGATLTNNGTAAISPALSLVEGSALGGTASFEPVAMTLVADLSGGTFEAVSLDTSLVKAGALGFTLSNVTDGSYVLFSGTAPTGSFASVSVGGSPLTDQGGGIFSAEIGGFTYTFADGTSILDVVAVPEPGTWLLMGIGLTCLLFRRRRTCGC